MREIKRRTDEMKNKQDEKRISYRIDEIQNRQKWDIKQIKQGGKLNLESIK